MGIRRFEGKWLNGRTCRVRIETMTTGLLLTYAMTVGCTATYVRSEYVRTQAVEQSAKSNEPAKDKSIGGRPIVEASPDPIDAAVSRGVELLLSMQEGDNRAEWPYEGVYRVRGEIPIGYRVGGTAICALALLNAPGYDTDARRHEAVAKATRFITNATTHLLMSPDYDGGYDVRGWGYTYGLLFLVRLHAAKQVPPEQAKQVEHAIKFFIDAIQKTELKESGGWNYARREGRDAVSPSSTFMTAPTLQALFAARQAGFRVDADVVRRGLDALANGRTQWGSYVYSGTAESANERAAVPGAVGRMACVETTLWLAGRSSIGRVRDSIDAFVHHWSWLEQRRAKPGTHAGPYAIAPYYFYFAHYYAAQAVEMLPEHERELYRRRLRELIFATRREDGSWNDRVFDRTANFSTAMCLMALQMPKLNAPPPWVPEREAGRRRTRDRNPDAPPPDAP